LDNKDFNAKMNIQKIINESKLNYFKKSYYITDQYFNRVCPL